MIAPITPITLTSKNALCGPAVCDVLAERVRQIDVLGLTPDRDLAHHAGELALACASYLNHAIDQIHGRDEQAGAPDPETWPWLPDTWRPSDPRRNLVKALALGLAALDRLDNAPCAEGDRHG